MDSIVKKLNSEADKELYRRADEVLHFLWDPIGVSDVPEARDEYHDYLPQVFMMLKENKSENEIAEYLDKSQIEQMAFPRDTERNLEIARTLLIWKEVIEEKTNHNKM